MDMEQDAERFYREMASQSRTPGIVRILTMLAEDEARHYQIVRRMAGNASSEMAQSTILADAKAVFSQLRGTPFDLDVSQVDVYRQAQDKEQRAHEFYQAKADETDDPTSSALLLKLADEEKRHYFLLDHVVEFVNRPQTWLEDAEFNHLDEY
jgi:rubrerythrin